MTSRLHRHLPARTAAAAYDQSMSTPERHVRTLTDDEYGEIERRDTELTNGIATALSPDELMARLHARLSL